MGVFKIIILKLTFFYLQFQCEMHLISFYTITPEQDFPFLYVYIWSNILAKQPDCRDFS